MSMGMGALQSKHGIAPIFSIIISHFDIVDLLKISKYFLKIILCQ